MTERISQLDLVFPTDVQPLYDAELLKQGDATVNASPISLAGAGGNNLVHGLWFLVL